MIIEPLGDSAFIITAGDRIAAEIARRVQGVADRITAADLPWVVELVPSYASVAVFIDPLRAPGAECAHELEQLLMGDEGDAASPVPHRVEVPVCYGGEFGPDLDDVATHAVLSVEEVIRRHAEAHYVVGCIGFAPGFPYLIGLPPELSIPRCAVPRREVPAGAVAIGGAQTGIYPQRSPGGWQIIGRTPLRLFSLDAEPPALLQAGDEVRFVPISADEFGRQSR